VGGDGKTSSEARTTLRKLQHDLRTPLGQILGYSEMLEEELSERELTQLLPDLRHIRSAATTLLGLVDGVFRSEEGGDTTSTPAPSDCSSSTTNRRTVNSSAVNSGARDTTCRRPTAAGPRWP